MDKSNLNRLHIVAHAGWLTLQLVALSFKCKYQIHVACLPAWFSSGSVAKVDMLANLFCLQRFMVRDSTQARSNGFKCVSSIVERWIIMNEARVKTMNGSQPLCKSITC